MATNCGVAVTKNADGSYLVTSMDTTNAKAYVLLTNAYDIVDDLTGPQEAIWQEILRQIKQL